MSTNFTQTANQLILDALQLIGVYGIGRTVSAEDQAVAMSFLNKMVKAWSSQGLHLWAKQEATLFVAQNTAQYTLGTAYAANADDVVSTTLSADAAGTSLTVASTSGMTVGDYIGVVLDDKSLQWSTISTIPSATSLTVGTSVTASSGNNVYTFTTKITKPYRILDARMLNGDIETPLTMISYEDYMMLPLKTSSAAISNQMHYAPKVSTGTVYLWPRPSDCNYQVNFTYERVLTDLDEASDTFDFPTEWLEPLTFQLALRLGPVFGRDQKVMAVIGPLAAEMMRNLLDADQEITSVLLQPELR